jgi:hypothetical protein
VKDETEDERKKRLQMALSTHRAGPRRHGARAWWLMISELPPRVLKHAPPPELAMFYHYVIRPMNAPFWSRKLVADCSTRVLRTQ